MNVVQTHAIVLRKVDYQDADQIVTLLTHAHGKISAIARGARKSAKRFGAGLQPFAVTQVEYTQGRDPSRMSVLRTTRLSTVYPCLIQDFERMQRAGEGLEFTRDVLQSHDADDRVFQVVQEFLLALDNPQASPMVGLLLFELRLLNVLGYAPRLTSCVRCGRAPGDRQKAAYHVQASSIRCVACGGGAVVLTPAVRERMCSVADRWLPALGAVWLPEEVQQLHQVVGGLRGRFVPDRG